MKPLIVLIVTFLLSLVAARVTTGVPHWLFSGNLAMCLMLWFTALGHFKFTKGMEMMVPEFMPMKRGLVYFTGILEPLLGLVLLVPAWRRAAGVALIVLLLIMLPANIYAAIRRVNYETAAFNGKGPAYLWFRVPMQLFLIEWIIYFSVWEMN